MSAVFSAMNTAERRQVAAIAAEVGCSPEAMVSAMAAQFLRLVQDAPAALPERPLSHMVQDLRKRALPGVGK